MSLDEAVLGTEYIIRDISTSDEEMKSFLFSLGCYSGEPITVVSIKDGRYNIDIDLAKAILI